MERFSLSGSIFFTLALLPGTEYPYFRPEHPFAEVQPYKRSSFEDLRKNHSAETGIYRDLLNKHHQGRNLK